jgi:hypothetical protein
MKIPDNQVLYTSISFHEDLMKNIVLAGVAGAVVLFIWSSLSWMILPWHQKTLHQFKDDAMVTAVLQANVDKSGVYLLPAETEADNRSPAVFAAVSLEGRRGMTSALLIYFVTECVAALLAAWLLSKTTISSYSGRIAFILVFAIAAAIIASLPNWNWWGFDSQYTLAAMADIIIGWLLAALVMARWDFATDRR